MTHGQEEKKEEPEPTEEILSNPCRATWHSRLPRHGDFLVGPSRNLILDWLSGTSSSHPPSSCHSYHFACGTLSSSCCVLRYWRGRFNSFRSQRHDTFFCVKRFFCVQKSGFVAFFRWSRRLKVSLCGIRPILRTWQKIFVCVLATHVGWRVSYVGWHLQATAGKQKTRISASPRSKTRRTWGHTTTSFSQETLSGQNWSLEFELEYVDEIDKTWQNQDLFLENEKREEDEEKARSWVVDGVCHLTTSDS